MKKSLLAACIILLLENLSYAQPVIETKSRGGLDLMSVVIGAVIGLIIGYFIGSKMAKK